MFGNAETDLTELVSAYRKGCHARRDEVPSSMFLERITGEGCRQIGILQRQLRFV